MKINIEKSKKSKIFYLVLKDGKALRMANILGCRVDTFPTKYMGLPFSPKPPSKKDWRGVIQKL